MSFHSKQRTAAVAMMVGGSFLFSPSLRAATASEVTLPYEQKFNSAADADGFTIVDANNDGFQWNWSSGAMVYEFNANQDADDWLITPQFRVDTRHVYKLMFRAMAAEQGVEKLSVCMGAEPAPAAMTTQLMASTEISASSPRNRSLLFRPTADGLLCLGFHALSSHLSGYQLTLDNISVSELTSVEAPDTVTNLRAVAEAEGGRSATVSFKLPTTTIEGAVLTGKLQAAIICWGDTLKKFADCDPGQELSYVHHSDATGAHVYTVVVANSAGTGLEASASTYIGEDSPSAVTSLSVKQTANNKLQVAWTAPERGAHGGWVAPGSVSYVVTDLQGKADTVKTSPYEYAFTPSDRQQLQGFTLQAYNSKGKSAVTVSDTLFVGDAYGLPFRESFARKRIASYPWVLQENAHAGWIVNDHGVYAEPVDQDGGLLSFSHGMEGSEATVILPKVTIKGSKHPRLKFWFWNDKRESNELSVYVKDASGKEHFLDRLSEYDADSEKGRWTVHSYALDDYASVDPIQVKFHAVGHVGESPVMVLYLDNVSITDVPEYDLALDSFTVARTTLKVGETDSFAVRVTNHGLYAADAYHLRLYRNGKVVAQAPGMLLQPDESVWMTLTDRPNSDADESSYYSLRLDYEGDVVPGNDSTDRVPVTILPGLPFVSELTATQSSDRVSLSWQQPLVKNQSAWWLTEGFESYPAFSVTNMGEWTLVDKDGRPTAGIMGSSGDFLDYPNAGDAMAFQVFNPVAAGLTASAWAPHNGSQVAAAFTSGRYAKNDDWLISPLVDGGQTITFWAKSPANNEYGTTEQLEVYYSTTTTDVSSFKKVGNTVAVPGSWKQYSAELPEGTRYFAIRCVSSNQYILFVDDVYYRQAEKKLSLLGYNVYRNDTLLTPAPVTATQYSDNALPKGHYAYRVTAVYDAGESTASPEAVVDFTTGISRVTTEGTYPVAYYNTAGQRVDAATGGVLLEKRADGTVRKVVRKH